MCIGSIQFNASACGGACNGPSVETRVCNPKDCPGIPLVYFCDVVKMFCASEDASFKFCYFTFCYNISDSLVFFHLRVTAKTSVKRYLGRRLKGSLK